MPSTVQTDDDFAAAPVPDSARSNWHTLFFATVGVATALFFAQITSIITVKYGGMVALGAVVYGCVVSSLIGYAVTRVAILTGFGTSLLARGVLGYRGAGAFSLLYGIACLTYFAAEASIMAASLSGFFPGLPRWVLLPSVVLLMVPLVWFGMRVLARFQLITLVLYAVLLAAALWVSAGVGEGRPWLGYLPAAAPPWKDGLLEAVSMMNGVVFIVGLLTADYARFIRRSQVDIGSLAVGVAFPLFCYAVTGLLGIWFATRYQEANPGVYLLTMLGAGGVVFAVATQLRVNVSNMYSGSLAFVNALEQVANLRVGRHLVVFVFGIVAAIVLLNDFIGQLARVLGVLGMFTACFTCLLLTERYLLAGSAERATRGYERGAVADWRWPALISWLLAAALGCSMQAGQLGGVWVPTATLVACGVQIVAYLVLSKVWPAQRAAGTVSTL